MKEIKKYLNNTCLSIIIYLITVSLITIAIEGYLITFPRWSHAILLGICLIYTHTKENTDD